MSNPHKIGYLGSSPRGSTNNNVISTANKRNMKMKNPIQDYVDTPKEGRLAPQPNNEMTMTRLVKWLLRLK